jgi:hypothetical protein
MARSTASKPCTAKASRAGQIIADERALGDLKAYAREMLTDKVMALVPVLRVPLACSRPEFDDRFPPKRYPMCLYKVGLGALHRAALSFILGNQKAIIRFPIAALERTGTSRK